MEVVKAGIDRQYRWKVFYLLAFLMDGPDVSPWPGRRHKRRIVVREKASNRVVYVDERAGRRDIELVRSELAELDEQQFRERWDRPE
jgi:hypothetical protein